MRKNWPGSRTPAPAPTGDPRLQMVGSGQLPAFRWPGKNIYSACYFLTYGRIISSEPIAFMKFCSNFWKAVKFLMGLKSGINSAN